MPANNKRSSQRTMPESAPRHEPPRFRAFKLATLLLGITLIAGFLFNQNSEYALASLADQDPSPTQGDAIPIIEWSYDQIRPAIAFNRHANEYFVTWQNQPSADSNAWYIFGRRTDDTGFPSGPPLAISESNALAHVAPDVAYHDGNQEYIVVWEYVWTETDHDIFARRLNSNGTIVGGEIPISFQDNRESNPVIEANMTNGEYLVVWSQQIGTDEFGWYQIRGQRLNATGTPTGDLISIGLSVSDQLQPALAHDSQRNRYLVVWQDQSAGGDFDIMGQLTDGNGDLIGAAIEIIGVAADQLVPQIAFNPDAQQYLVVWEDHSRDAEGAWDVRGRRLNSDGELVGAEIPIAETYLYHRLNPDVAYKSEEREYMVVWENEFQTNDHDIFQRRIVGDGSFADIARALSNSERFESRPVIASDNAAGFVTAWEQDNSDDGTGIDIYGIQTQVSVTATPTPTPTSQPPAVIWAPMILR